MKTPLPVLLSLPRSAWSVVLFVTIASNVALAQDSAAAKRLEADMRAVAMARRGQWVELPTGGWSTRQFLVELQRDRNDNSVLLQLRIDYQAPGADGVASTVQTTWLHCDAGQQRVVATYGYDMQGRQVFGNKTPDAQLEPIEHLYAGRAHLICSEQYLLLDVTDGYGRLGQVLLARRAERAAALADRPIPLPAADAAP